MQWSCDVAGEAAVALVCHDPVEAVVERKTGLRGDRLTMRSAGRSLCGYSRMETDPGIERARTAERTSTNRDADSPPVPRARRGRGYGTIRRCLMRVKSLRRANGDPKC